MMMSTKLPTTGSDLSVLPRQRTKYSKQVALSCKDKNHLLLLNARIFPKSEEWIKNCNIIWLLKIYDDIHKIRLKFDA